MKKILYYTIVIIVAILPYINSLKNPLVWDDVELIFNDPNIKELKNIPKFFMSRYWREEFPSRKNTYRPLRAVSFTIDYAIWKKNSFGYHLTNLILNTIAVLLTFIFAKMVSNSDIIGLITAIVFATLPVHVETVSWVKNRGEIMCYIFLISSLIMSLRALAKQSLFYYLQSLICFVLALMSKENAVILPIVMLFCSILIYLTTSKENRSWLKFVLFVIPYFLILGSYTIYNFTNFKMEIGNTCSVSIFSKDALIIPATISEYIKILLWPFPLNPERDIDVPQRIISSSLGITLVVVILAIVLLNYELKTKNLFGYGFAISFVIITLLPVANIINLEGRPIAEQRLYLPSFGFAYIIGLIFSSLLTQPCKLRDCGYHDDGNTQAKACGYHDNPVAAPFIPQFAGFRVRKIITLSILLTIVLFNGLMSFARNYDWADMKSLLEKAVIASPFNARAKVNLAQTYRHLGEHEKAIEILEALCELVPDYTNGLLALGRCYEEVGKYQSAIETYEKVLKTNPNSLQALNSLGNLYFKTGQYSLAVETYKKALKISPNSVQLRYNLAVAYEKMKDFDNAINEYKLAAELSKDKSQYYTLIGMIYENKNEVDKAIEAYKKAIEFEPDYAIAMYNLGMLSARTGNYKEALDWFLKVEKNLPAHIDNLNNIGIIYDILGDTEESIAYFNKAISINPNEPKAYYNRAQVYLKLGKKDLAKQDLAKVLQLEPKNVNAKKLLTRI